MKQVTLTMFELTRQQVLELDPDAKIMVYDAITDSYEIWHAGYKHQPARSRADCSDLRFFLFTVGELPKA